uniref:Secreted protein n=1 Tax=Streptomyces sp. NBC_00003 TaxID=2903608 RepID=A0AAU2UXL3_9ACTN
MRRCATVAAIALCGALAASTAAPAFAATRTPVVSAPETARAVEDRRVGADDKDEITTELAAMKKEVDQLVAGEKKDAGKDAADAKKEAEKDVADIKKEVAGLLKGIAATGKDAVPQNRTMPKPASPVTG